ncbi:MAG: outer membrane beta-barrel protein [Roseicyclus sp.]
MIRSLIAVGLTVVGSHAAVAGGVVPSEIVPVVVAPADDPFDGFYGGLSLGTVQGDVTDVGTATTFAFNDGTAYGGFLGYNFQNGALVLGGEARVLRFNDHDFSVMAGVVGGPVITNEGELDGVTDLRGRVGYAFGDVMVYGAAGWSWATLTALGGEADVDGHNVGLGIEYNVSDSIFVGFDYTDRDLSGANATNDFDVNNSTATLRVGFRF